MLDTKTKISDAAYQVALDNGLVKLTRTRIAEHAGVNYALVNYYWGNGLDRLIDAVIARAEREKEEGILKQAVALGYLKGYALALIPEA